MISRYIFFPFSEFCLLFSDAVFWNNLPLYAVRSNPYNLSFLATRDWDSNFTEVWFKTLLLFPKTSAVVLYYISSLGPSQAWAKIYANTQMRGFHLWSGHSVSPNKRLSRKEKCFWIFSHFHVVQKHTSFCLILRHPSKLQKLKHFLMQYILKQLDNTSKPLVLNLLVSPPFKKKVFIRHCQTKVILQLIWQSFGTEDNKKNYCILFIFWKSEPRSDQAF